MKLQLHLNQGIEIKNWIDSGCDWQTGKALHARYGTNKTLGKLFEKNSSRFYQDKLYQELISIKVAADQALVITPVEVKAIAKSYEELPEKLQQLDREKGVLYKRILVARTELKKHLKLKTNGRITMRDALEEMAKLDNYKRLKPFSVTYISYNQRTGRGGEILSFPNCYLKVVNNTGSRVKKGAIHYSSRQPDHWRNGTRNFEPIGSGKIMKLHIWLMIEFNGMEVITSELG
jgi:hypothetical protein